MAKKEANGVLNLLSNPKSGKTYFGAQMKGWLVTLEPNGKSAYEHFAEGQVWSKR